MALPLSSVMKKKNDHVLALIPARYASSRLPGKLLKRIKGRSILDRVYHQVARCTTLSDHAIILDHALLQQEAERIGARYVVNDGAFICGTDRCINSMDSFIEPSILINVQGDQPFIDPSAIDALVEAMLQDPTISIATLRTDTPCDNISPHIVKVYVDQEGWATRFSRQSHQDQMGYQHIGVYGFRRAIIDVIKELAPTANEQSQSLEQLRWMDHSLAIYTVPVAHVPLSIDIPDDLNRNY